MLLAFNHWYLWGGLLGLLWLICLLSAGVLTWKHGHRVMFFIGSSSPSSGSSARSGTRLLAISRAPGLRAGLARL